MASQPQLEHRIFISHSHQDNDFGVRLAKDLRSVLGNIDAVWYDVSGGLYGGDAWWDRIVEEITTRNVFILLLSPDAMESKWVRDELRIAWLQKNSAGMIILPVLYRNCTVRADLKTLQNVSFIPPISYKKAFNELLRALRLPISTTIGTTLLYYYRNNCTIKTIAWSPNGKYIATAGGDWNHREGGTVRIWDAFTGNDVCIYDSSNRIPVHDVEWSLDSKFFASCSTPIAQLHNAITGNVVTRYWVNCSGAEEISLQSSTGSLAWSPNNKYIAVALDNCIVCVFDATKGNVVATCGDYHYRNYIGGLTSGVAWAPTGRYIAHSGSGIVTLWEVLLKDTTCKVKQEPVLYENGGNRVVWSPLDELLATALGDTVVVWNPSSGKRILTFQDHANKVKTIAWSPDGKYIASGSSVGAVNLWETTYGNHIYTYQGHSGSVNSVTWSPDGKYIASGGNDKAVHVWQAT